MLSAILYPIREQRIKKGIKGRSFRWGAVSEKDLVAGKRSFPVKRGQSEREERLAFNVVVVNAVAKSDERLEGGRKSLPLNENLIEEYSHNQSHGCGE